ncbi:esterase family protein [candidate division WWE3 bacterium]|nr:esterase family protein [candidate division WWE3 bacterium]
MDVTWLTDHHYIESTNSDTNDLIIISPARRKGIDSGLITQLFNQSTSLNYSIVMFDYTYFVNHAEPSDDYVKEYEDLKKVVKHVRQTYPDKRVHLIGHSLGGVVSSWMAKEWPEVIASVGVFGYIPDKIDFGSYQGRVHIVQGDFDDYGDEVLIANSMEAFGIRYTLDMVLDADHLFRGTGYDTDVTYEADAARIMLTRLNESIDSISK